MKRANQATSPSRQTVGTSHTRCDAGTVDRCHGGDNHGGVLGTMQSFFFQAEEGIRDVAVTGVQTCALPILGAAQPLQDMVFGDSPLSVGRLGGPLLLGDDRLVVVKVLEHRKPQVKPLAEVRDGIVAAIRKQRGTDAAVKAAQAARAKLEAGASFDEEARELSVNADPARFIG